MIALLCSVQTEADQLIAKTTEADTVRIGSISIREGSLAGRHVLFCVGGMGKVNAAHAATLMLTQFRPEGLVIFGVGGAYPSSGARIGDIAIAREEIAGDEGVLTPEGYKNTEYMGIPLVKTATLQIQNIYPATEVLLKRSLQALNSSSGRFATHVGPFVTLSTCTGTKDRAQELEERYSGLCENMEGAAAAHIATLHGMPWLEVRGISNIVEDRDLAKWDIPKAAHAVQQAVLTILDSWNSRRIHNGNNSTR